jgi:hypothetical protein
MKERADMTQQEITPQMWQTMAERISSVETTLEDFAKKNDEMEARQKAMMAGIEKITAFMERLNGGVRVVLWMGGAAATLASAAAWILGHVSFKP